MQGKALKGLGNRESATPASPAAVGKNGLCDRCYVSANLLSFPSCFDQKRNYKFLICFLGRGQFMKVCFRGMRENYVTIKFLKKDIYW